MALKPGYKESEVGVIPKGWDAEPLGPHVQICSGESPSQFRFGDSGVPYFKVEQLNNDSKYLSSTPYFFRSGKTVPRGSVIFPKRGASILLNKVRILESDSFMDTNLMTLTPAASLYGEYLYYALAYTGLWRVADTTSIPQINNKHIRPLIIPMPKLPEQRAIAGALGHVDGLLASLAQLIANKRDLKQAAMQQLLTGRTRLPGFSEEWETKHLGEIGSFSKGKGIQKNQVVAAGLPCIRYGEIYTHHNDHIRAFFSFIPAEVAKRSQRLHTGDILFAGSGETAEEIGKCVAFLDDAEAYAGSDIVILSPVGADSAFLGYLMNHAPVVEQRARIAQGDAVVHISTRALAQVTVRIPMEEEQTAIASILSVMYAELAGLGQRLAKTRALKQGMMQDLLTGRTRLV